MAIGKYLFQVSLKRCLLYRRLIYFVIKSILVALFESPAKYKTLEKKLQRLSESNLCL